MEYGLWRENFLKNYILDNCCLNKIIFGYMFKVNFQLLFYIRFSIGEVIVYNNINNIIIFIRDN